MKKTKKRALYVFAALLAVVFVLACLAGFAACGESTEDEPTVSSVSISGSKSSMTVGDETTLTASVIMSDGSTYDGSYSWSTSDSSVVSLSATNTASVMATAKAAGSATITLAVDNNKTASCSVTVSEAEEVVTKTEVAVLTTETFNMDVGLGYPLPATDVVVTLYDDGTANLDCSLATGYGCTYSINNTVMTFVIAGLGTTSYGTITYASTGAIEKVEYTNFAGQTQNVTFTATSSATKISIGTLYADSFKMNVGIELTATDVVVTLYSDGSANLDCSLATGYGCTYSISNGTMTLTISGLSSTSTGTVTYGDDGSILAVSFSEFANITQNVVLAIDGYTPEEEPEEEPTAVSDADELAEALEQGGEIVLADEIEIEEALEIQADTTLDLAGNTLSTDTNWTSASGYYDSEALITVSAGATLTISDSDASEAGEIKYSYSTTDLRDAAGNVYTTAENVPSGTTAYGWNSSVYNAAAIEVEAGGSLVMESGTIESSSVGVRVDGVSTDSATTTVTISGGTIESEYYTIWASGDSTVNVEDGTISGTSKGLFIAGDDKFGYGTVQSGTTTLNVSGGTISCESDSAICTIGNTSGEHKVVNISGGTIIGPDLYDETTQTATPMPAIYNASGNLTITGGTITGSTAVEHRGGELTISDGTLVCNATGAQNTPAYAKSGAVSYGYALAIYPFDHSASVAWNKTMVVAISGGTFSGDIYISDNTLNGTDSTGATVSASISVSGGTVYGDIVLATGSSLNLSEIVGENVMTNSTRVTAVAESDSRLVIDEEESTAFSATNITVSYDSSTKTYTVSGTSVALSSDDGTLDAFWGNAASNHANCEYITFEVNVAAGETLKITSVDADGETTKVRAMYGEGVTEKLTDENGDEIKTADGVWVIDVTKEDASQGSFKMTIDVIGEDGETVETYYVVIGTITSSATVTL